MLTASLDEDAHLVAVDEEGSGGTLERQRRAREDERASFESDSSRETMDELSLGLGGSEFSDLRERKASATRAEALESRPANAESRIAENLRCSSSYRPCKPSDGSRR